MPSAAGTSTFGFAVIAIAVFAVLGVGFWIAWARTLPKELLPLIPLVPIIITVAVIRAKLKRGQRTAEGRAICDQIEGFRTYLATAEADQLKFEEGEDIFSKYLPWAIIFELADRWAKICGDLVAMGRLPNQTPYWYIGNYQMAAFNTAFLTSSLTSAATPVLPPPAQAAPGSAVAAPSAEVASPAAAAVEAAAAAGEFLARGEEVGKEQWEYGCVDAKSRGMTSARGPIGRSQPAASATQVGPPTHGGNPESFLRPG